jgi:hypothetical protein
MMSVMVCSACRFVDAASRESQARFVCRDIHAWLVERAGSGRMRDRSRRRARPPARGCSRRAVDHTKGFTEDLPAPTKNEDGSWTINLRDHEGWKSADFDLKANHLKQFGEDGELTRNTNDRDPKNTAEWRREKEREIFWDAKDQNDLDTRIAELDSQQIDHAQDLQLNGNDVKDNMWGIDSATNHGMGLQINSQLSQVPEGATVRINIIPGKFTPSAT